MKARFQILLSLMGATACFELPENDAPPQPPTLVALEPARVAPDEPVQLAFSAPLDAPPTLEVRRDGVAWPAEVALDFAQVVLRPAEAWPAGARLEIVAVEPIRSAAGGQWAPEPATLGWFSVEVEAGSDPPVTLLGPFEGPANVGWLLLSGPEEILDAADGASLTGHGPPRGARVAQTGAGRALLEIEAPVEPCGGDCGGRAYVVSLMPAGWALGEVRTSSAVDRRPPVVEWVDATVRGDTIQVRVFADEPVVVQGRLHPSEGEPVALMPPPRIADEVLLGASAPLRPSTRYRVVLDVRDVAGNPAEVPVPEVETADVPEVRILEVVAAPLRDWSDSEGEGVPFDPWPGRGAVNDNDEWVEIVNRSGRAVDLLRAGLELRALDTSPSVTPVDAAPGLYFGLGGDKRGWRPGEALVVRPRGSLSQRSLRIEVWGAGALLDAIQLGNAGDAVHPSGAPPDALHESIALDPDGAWRWCVPSPGDPLPNRACR